MSTAQAEVVDLLGHRAPIERVVSADAAKNDFVGLAGEHLVCSALSEFGVVAHHVRAAGYDVVAAGSEGLLRIQVKTTAERVGGRYSFSVLKEVGRHTAEGKRAKRPLDRRDCDLVALVALDKRRTIFLPVERCQNKYIGVGAQEFDIAGIEQTSWQACQ